MISYNHHLIVNQLALHVPSSSFRYGNSSRSPSQSFRDPHSNPKFYSRPVSSSPVHLPGLSSLSLTHLTYSLKQLPSSPPLLPANMSSFPLVPQISLSTSICVCQVRLAPPCALTRPRLARGRTASPSLPTPVASVIPDDVCQVGLLELCNNQHHLLIPPKTSIFPPSTESPTHTDRLTAVYLVNHQQPRSCPPSRCFAVI